MTEQAEVETKETKAEESEQEEQTQTDELETEEPELEEWQKEEAETKDDQDEDYQVDGKLHQAMKTKLKGRVSDRETTIERLTKERDDALKLKPAEETALIKPKQEDHDTDEAYDTALEKYNDDRAVEVWNRKELEKTTGEAQASAQKAVVEAVDGHYERASELIEKSGIKPEVYQTADATVRKAVESIKPKLGDIIVDQVISILGDGSEKVMYFLGRNKVALAKFQSLLSSDPSGMKAAVYLGQEKQRLTNPTKPQSNAPAPASEIKGDELVRGAEAKFKKKYDAAHTKNDNQAAYNAKKEARAAGVDVSKW